jgi:hypothetical protein
VAPEIISDTFSKPTTPQEIYFDYKNPIKTTHFYNVIDTYIYKLVELKSKDGSDFSGCVELFKYEFNDAVDIVLEEQMSQLDEDQDLYAAAEMFLNQGFSPDKTTITARYVYKNKTVLYENEEIEGKQIKGAYIMDGTLAVGLTRFVYRYLRDKYGILISDNIQTADGHRLWAFGVCKWAEVCIYDCYLNKIVARLPKEGIVPENGIIPWSIKIPFLPIDKTDFLRKGFWIDQGSLHHIVLLIKAPPQ